VWQAFMNTFDALPVAAIINDKTLCLHSGLSPSLDTIAQIEELDRYAFVIKLLVQYSCACACACACAFACACACAADSPQPLIGRFQDIPPEGPLADLAWNQPEDVEGWQIPPRAAGFLFGSGTVVDSSRRSGKRTITKQFPCVVCSGNRRLAGQARARPARDHQQPRHGGALHDVPHRCGVY
jgi:diadenosine tetraphosphatase ApaH/serine/threonine PP2A family protein phosphatase